MIMQANEKLAMVQQMNIARDVAFGMEYLSALGFVHRVRIGIKLHSSNLRYVLLLHAYMCYL